jgi:hypothetical protein
MNNQYFGPYRGQVTNNVDPDGLMRIKARVPDVLGELETNWALPCVPPGFGSVPDVGTSVWIEFEAGDPTYPIWMGTFGSPDSSRDGEK